MKNHGIRTLAVVCCLVFATCGIKAYANKEKESGGPAPPVRVAENGNIGVTAALVRDKVFSGGDGIVELSLTLSAHGEAVPQNGQLNNVDMVIVLDRSGSMQGEKLGHAREAVVKLLNLLGAGDRFALVSYSDRVRVHTGLVPVTLGNLASLTAMAREISPGGGTNLGAGLGRGLDTHAAAKSIGNRGRVILISDGLANQGITDPSALARIASSATRRELTVSTVGVGMDFNEQLMTLLADHGTGNYYFLENPTAFAGVFEKEFRDGSTVAASGVAVEIPLPRGVSLVHASGYPIELRNQKAIFYPGDLVAGRTRRVFLRLKVPTGKGETHAVRGIRVSWQKEDQPFFKVIPGSLEISCVDDPHEAAGSVNKGEWARKVIQSDYNRLKEEVAGDIRKGDEKKALGRIEAYRSEKATMNRVVESEAVKGNLENDVEALRQTVKDTFSGPAAAVPMKRKKNAKVMQYEGYKGKRSAN